MVIPAVLTGDIVNSTRLGEIAEKKLLKVLKQLLAPHKFEFYRETASRYILQMGALPCKLRCCAVQRLLAWKKQ